MSEHDDAQQAAALLELGDALLELDAQWRVVRVNGRQERLSGRPRSATVGRLAREAWPELARAESAARRELERCMRERVPVWFEDEVGPQPLWLDVTAYPTGGGGVVAFLRDATERRRAEQAARDAAERTTEFLGVLSHELRNPLAPIRTSVQVLGHADPASEPARRARAIIARQVEHLTRLVEDLLEVKRLSAGKLRVHRRRMDLVQQIRETVEDMRPLFTSRALALELQAPAAPLWIDGDRTRVAQLLTNLLHNAAKFTDAGGHVTVAIEAADGRVRLRVRDDGVGVAPEVLGTLFEPFVQGERTIDRSAGGLGLGLSLVRGIAELHGGEVSARSDGIGQGAEFEVTLPATEDGAAALDEEAPGAAPGTRQRVLVIEDNDDAAESLRDVLELMGGHEVLLASDGAAGVEAARLHGPQVVLCDLGLPVVDGYEVARRIRTGQPAPGPRLIALSGYASAKDVERAIRAGFDYHVAKPPDTARLLALVGGAPPLGAALTVPDPIATGHHEVDAQHAAILARAARLRAAPAEGIWEALRFLQHHTASHFEYEEKLMVDVGFPDLEPHQRRHREFLDEFHRLRERLRTDGATPGNAAALVDAVERWVTQHVLRADRVVAEFIRGLDRPPGGDGAGGAGTAGAETIRR
jgi:two-component system CheB/CheR fusion protein